MSFETIQESARNVLISILAFEFVALIISGHWGHAILTAFILLIIVIPMTSLFKTRVFIPAEIQFFIIVFIFATLFLGEVRDYYVRIWWWDLALHTSSGFLLGILGFLVVYLINETESVDMHLQPSFVALFAFLFSVSIGAIWEIFEFSMDQLFGFNMQKPMLGDPSGLTDTMWDLIVDTLGALVAVLMGWAYMRRAVSNGTDHWLRRFVIKYPNFFS